MITLDLGRTGMIILFLHMRKLKVGEMMCLIFWKTISSNPRIKSMYSDFNSVKFYLRNEHQSFFIWKWSPLCFFTELPVVGFVLFCFLLKKSVSRKEQMLPFIRYYFDLHRTQTTWFFIWTVCLCFSWDKHYKPPLSKNPGFWQTLFVA